MDIRIECSDCFRSATGSVVLMAEKCPVDSSMGFTYEAAVNKKPRTLIQGSTVYELHEKQTVQVVLFCNLFVQIRAGSSVVNRHTREALAYAYRNTPISGHRQADKG
jgi:hypothetical protein